MHPDSGKPLPQDVLRTLSLGLEFENILTQLCGEGEETVSSIENDVKVMKSVTCSANEENLIKLGHLNSNDKDPGYMSLKERNIALSLSLQYYFISVPARLTTSRGNGSPPPKGKDACPKALSGGEILASEKKGTPSPQATNTVALGLLKWLATSQAAKDLNSDDELLSEAILRPLLPGTTIDKVLDKANTDYERESQKEC